MQGRVRQLQVRVSRGKVSRRKARTGEAEQS